MKKALAIVLALVLVLPLCGSAFAAEEQLTVTSETVRKDNTVTTRYWYKNAEGTVVRIYSEIYNLSGSRLGEELDRFDEEGRIVYQRATGMLDGVWRNDEQNITYLPDGSQTYEGRIVWNYPGGRKEYAVIQGTGDVEGYKSETREQFGADGNKLCEAVTETGINARGEYFEQVDTSYTGGNKESVLTRKLDDGTTITTTEKTVATGAKYFDGFLQVDPDGSYVRTETTYSKMANGREIAIQSKVYTDDNGNPLGEEYKMVFDKDGYGKGKGILRDASGRTLADLIVQRYDEEDENGETVTRDIKTYLYPDGRVDLRYVTINDQGRSTERFDRDIKDYDGEENELPEDIDWDSDDWDIDSGDWNAFQYLEDTYTGDPAWLSGDENAESYIDSFTFETGFDSGRYGDIWDEGDVDDASGWD